MKIETLPERFEGTAIDVVIFGGEKWLGGQQIADALGFKNPRQAASDMYRRNKSEFDDSTNIALEMTTAGGVQLVRLFNARGASLFAMKAQTPKGEAFRRWVLDVLEGSTDSAPVEPGAGIPAGVLHNLRMMFLQRKGGTTLVRLVNAGLATHEIAKVLEVTPNSVSMRRRVAEFLGLVAPPADLERRQKAANFLALAAGREAKKAYRERLKAKQALQSVAADLDGVRLLDAPTGEATDEMTDAEWKAAQDLRRDRETARLLRRRDRKNAPTGEATDGE